MMNDYNDTKEREQCLEESIRELQAVNKKMARLNVIREKLTDMIIDSIGHNHEGQKSYDFGVWKIEVKTPFIFSLNKKLYESGDISLPDEFNPIKHSVSYAVDKKLCEQYMDCAPKSVRDALVELIDKRAGKASVVVKERV